MATTDIKSQVEARLATVTQRYSAAIADLSGRFLKTSEVESSLAALKGLSGRVDGWAKNGRDALKANKAPDGAGWSGWIKAGQGLLDGIASIYADGKATAVLENIAESVVAATKEAPARVAKAAKATATAVGETARAAVNPLLVPLALAALAALAFLYLRRR